MSAPDISILVLMAVAAMVAAGTFASITKYLYDHGLADRNHPAPNILDFYKAYVAHTRKTAGRIGGVFWAHSISAGLFIAMGVIYTIVRFILPLLMGT